MSDPIQRLGDSLRDASIMADGEAVEAYCMLSEAVCTYLPADVLSRVMREVASAGVAERLPGEHLTDRQRAVAFVEAERQERAQRIARGDVWTSPAMMVGDWPECTTDAQRAAIVGMLDVYASPESPCDGLYSYAVEAVSLDALVADGVEDVQPYVGAVEARFTYVADGEAPRVDAMTGRGLGLEVTVWDRDGEVITSQDLG